jgi:hypothetical protein
MNRLSVVNSTATIESPAVLVYSDILNFDLSQCSTIEEVLSNINFMFGAVNRASLYSAYVVGKLVDPVVLKQRFGVPSVSALARLLDCSSNTLLRYRTVSEMLTPNQVEQLANRKVSINAVLKLAECKKDHPAESEAVMDLLLTGCEIKTESDVQRAILDKVIEKVRSYNLLPGSEPGAEEGKLLETPESDPPAIEQFNEASHNPILDAEDLGEDFEDEDDEPKSSSPSSTSSKEPTDSDGGSLNLKEIKLILRTVRSWIAAAKRDVVGVQDIGDKLDAILEKDAVILGDEESHEELADLMEQLYANILSASEALIPEVMRGIAYGYLKRGILLPQTADVETLFRKES